jgi:hypothetical protein
MVKKSVNLVNMSVGNKYVNLVSMSVGNKCVNLVSMSVGNKSGKENHPPVATDNDERH